MNVITEDGRSLACVEVGDRDGKLVIHNHGGPSSRLEAHLFADAAAKHKLRFVCVDRPGMGQSSPQDDRTYAGWAFDVTTIERPVHIWQGLADTLVAPIINLTIADRMPGAVWHSVENAGHFIAVGEADDILAMAAAELRA